MNYIYILSLTTFLIWPIIGYLLRNIKISYKAVYSIAIILLIHNLLYLIGFSFIGENIDYTIFSLEYLFICALVFSIVNTKNIFQKIIKIFGRILIILGFINGLLGILIFIVISKSLMADKIYYTQDNENQYQVRRYSMSFVTLEDTRYDFETYKTYQYLPFEYLMDKTTLFELRSNLIFSDDCFKIEINEKKMLIFSSCNGNKLIKNLK